MIRAREILMYLAYKYEGNWDKVYDAIKNKENFDEEELQVVRDNLNCDYVTILDDDYPQILKNCYKPPFTLFYHGDIKLIENHHNLLAVVGTRKCSDYSIQHERNIIKDLNNKLIIVSGLATGIDGAAHEAAIQNGGKTVGVLGCGINYIYPKNNAKLYEIMKKDHLIISEYPGQIAPDKSYFPFRNRIITGLSWGVFVPEVHERSGTMVSIAHALQQNREVLILPQPARNGTFNNHLIKDGACLIETGQDILEEKN